MASTFTSDTLPADHKAAIRQMKHALRAQLGDVQQIFNQLSDDIATRVAEINALKAQGDAVWPVLVLCRYQSRSCYCRAARTD
ncbi:protein [Escherichia coli]|uniref:Protein n=1 Tax=Escherichia coli TaxID=562 RepID=A0A377DJ20_ECOLX|nr:protein [Escherichia coli]